MALIGFMKPFLTAFSSLVLASSFTANLTKLDKARVEEAYHLLEAAGNNIWPRWGYEKPPLLLRKGEYDYLFYHPNPPPCFKPLAEKTDIYYMKGHVLKSPKKGSVAANTIVSINGFWCIHVPAKEEMRNYLKGKKFFITSDDYITTILHESFHCHQFHRLGVDPLELKTLEDWRELRLKTRTTHLGLYVELPPGEEKKIVETAINDPINTYYQKQEAFCLFRAIRTKGKDELYFWVSNFLEIRKKRREHIKHSIGHAEIAIAYAKEFEWSEGLAHYSDGYKLWEWLVNNPYHPIYEMTDDPDFHFYKNAKPKMNRFLLLMLNLRGNVLRAYDRYSALGMGQALVLDKLAPDWKEWILGYGSGRPLDEVIEEILTYSGY